MLQLLRKYAGRSMARRTRARAHAFLKQTDSAGDIQRARLLELIARNADSDFGRDHHFAEIKSPADYRKRVPIRGYEGHEPYIDRVRKGETSALFGPNTKVLMFAMTSGTTARPKTIPVTAESLNNYRHGWTNWGILAFDAHPGMLAEGLKPILQLASDWRESVTPSGIPCGAITGLTAHMQSRLVRSVYCMPAVAARIKDIEAKYYVALRTSVHRDLGATIAANPSTILAISRLGDREKSTLVRDIRDGTLDSKWKIPADVRISLQPSIKKKRPSDAKRLESIIERTGRLLPKDYWPNLQFLANWTGGTMGAYLKNYPEYFGDVPVRDVGLIASEGRFTVPVEDYTTAGILDIAHHYFEFLPEDQLDKTEPETVEAVDLIEGRRYYILPTTAGGLYRYQIFDLVRCVGFHGRAPLVEFLNKGAHFSSMTGEKLSEFQVVAALGEATARAGVKLKSFLLLPSWGEPPHYSLLVEGDDLADDGGSLLREAEAALCRQNGEYLNRLETRRLGPLRLRRLPPGSWVDFQRRRLQHSGGTVEQYKQPCLLADLGAIEGFAAPGPG